MLFDGRYRYIKAPREELYDLKGDPRERENIAGPGATPQDGLRAALDRLTGDASKDARGPKDAGDARPDPKDKIGVLETYRAALDLAAGRKWGRAIALLQGIVKEDD